MTLSEVVTRIAALQTELVALRDALTTEQLLLQKGGAATSLSIDQKGPFTPVFAIRADPGLDFALSTDNVLTVKGNKYIKFISSSIMFDSPSISMNGHLSAALEHSSPFIWRRGQEAIRMHHSSNGFPIVTRIKSNKHNTTGFNARLFINQGDQYWYLKGDEGITELEAVFIGKV